MEGVGIEKIVKKLQLKKYIEDMELKGHRIRLADVNRPALQLSGYFEHFEQSRVQIIGMVEMCIRDRYFGRVSRIIYGGYNG